MRMALSNFASGIHGLNDTAHNIMRQWVRHLWRTIDLQANAPLVNMPPKALQILHKLITEQIRTLLGPLGANGIALRHRQPGGFMNKLPVAPGATTIACARGRPPGWAHQSHTPGKAVVVASWAGAPTAGG